MKKISHVAFYCLVMVLVLSDLAFARGGGGHHGGARLGGGHHSGRSSGTHYKASYKTHTATKVKVGTHSGVKKSGSYGSVIKKHRSIKASGGERDKRGRIKRSAAAKRDFMRQTGYPNGRPGYVVDHIIPLKRGGRDDPSNMQWQTIQESKAKDKWE